MWPDSPLTCAAWSSVLIQFSRLMVLAADTLS